MTIRKGFRSPSNKALESDIKKLMALFQSLDASALETQSRQFIKRYPKEVLGHKGLIAALNMQERHEEALAAADAGLAAFPEDSELHNNRGACLIELSRFEEAVTSCTRAVQIDPNNSDAFCNRGVALKEVGEWNLAFQSYHQALALKPRNASALHNVAIVLMLLEKVDEAVACFEAALAMTPQRDDIRRELAYAKEEQKKSSEARQEFERILDNNAADDFARSGIIGVLRSACEFEVATEHAQRLLQRLRNGTIKNSISSFALLSLEETTREDQLNAARIHAEGHFRRLITAAPAVIKPSGRRHDKLRIGYLSADLNSHATSILMAGVLEAQLHSNLQTFAYSNSHNDGTDLRKRVEAAFHTFHDIRHESVAETARRIEADEIDILVDLKGYTKHARLEICALRPAPVVVSWLGYPGTLGHPMLADYIIGDPIVTPLEHQSGYSETIAQLPHCYQPNDRLRGLEPPPSRAEAGLPENAFVFCSFNQPYKITARVFDQWCRLLRETPGSVLWLHSSDDARDNLRARATANGVDASRLLFADLVPPDQHIRRLQLADLALDTFPYGSHTTGADALWAGVPLVTICGDTFASRVSSSLVTNAGLPELVTNSPEQAADLALALFRDRARLRELKTRLIEGRDICHLFNTEEFARDLERLYEAIWAQHQAGVRAPIVLSPASA